MALGPIWPPSWLTWSSFFPSLALSSLNKHAEAVAYYKKALELDPDNDTYKSNLKIAELKLREAPSPVSLSLEGDDGGGGQAGAPALGVGRVVLRLVRIPGILWVDISARMTFRHSSWVLRHRAGRWVGGSWSRAHAAGTFWSVRW